MAAYVNEFAKAKGRGRFSLSIQVLFSVGLMVVALVGAYVVPRWGWQWMFIIGAVPAFIAMPMRTVLPELPRWLASRGRYDEADRALARIEDIATREGMTVAALPADLPQVAEARPRISELFKGIYLRRTISVWLLWVGAYFVSYGITAWMPSLFRTVYHLDIQQSLIYGLINSGVGLVRRIPRALSDRGRRAAENVHLQPRRVLRVSAFLRLPAAAQRGRDADVATAVSSFSAPRFCRSRPTRRKSIRPICARWAAASPDAWQRGASMVGTSVVGWVLPHSGINAVFVMFGLFALMGAIVAIFFAVETRAQVLERLSPAVG